MVQKTMARMQLDPKDHADAVSTEGSFISIFASFFTLVAKLQRARRRFAIIFRSFGSDHKKVETEWNAFCEMRHPIFSKLLEDIGPLDGSAPGVPDRRCNSFHTLYRDAEGLLIALDTFTNGPEELMWDAWAKQDPKPPVDDRDGRRYLREVLKARTIEGTPALQRWFRDFLTTQGTSAFKDDWAWWTFQKEKATAGKPMLLLPGEDTRQFFFDDNVEWHDTRIVDCRDPDFNPVSMTSGLDVYYTKANPVEAVLDDDYFLKHLIRSESMLSQGSQSAVSRPHQTSVLTTANQDTTDPNFARWMLRRIAFFVTWLRHQFLRLFFRRSAGGSKRAHPGNDHELPSTAPEQSRKISSRKIS
jgi:hypothetical protein